MIIVRANCHTGHRGPFALMLDEDYISNNGSDMNRFWYYIVQPNAVDWLNENAGLTQWNINFFRDSVSGEEMATIEIDNFEFETLFKLIWLN